MTAATAPARPGIAGLAALAAGGAHALALSGRMPLWGLQLLATAALFALLQRATPRQAARHGFGFGLVGLLGSVWWLFISMHRYGDLPAWMAAAAVLALCAFLSVYMAAAAWAFARWRSGRPGPDALLFAALWLLAELARAVLFTGFPWAASGYAHTDGPLAAWAPWIGVYGIGALAALLAALGVAWLKTMWRVLMPAREASPGRAALGRRLGALGAGVVGLLLLGVPLAAYNPALTQSAGTLQVTLLQGNVPQDQKFVEQYLPAALLWHVRALKAARSDLVVAPETALPLLPEQLPEGLWPGLKAHFASGRTHALFGVPLGNERSGYTNSVVGLAPGQPDEYRYDKHHLVPFGEFIPTGFRWFTEMMNIPLGDFARGPLRAPSFAVGAQRVAPNICYEDLFGEELAARFHPAAQAPTLFANVGNIGWFGDTIAVDQHLQISRMRSREFQRAMLRATNTGATAVVDHRGVVRQQLAPFTQGVLEATVEGRVGITPFAAWSARAGLWPLLLLAAAVAGRAAWQARRRSAG